jgi:pyruvate/2-oxoglutarate dehydrogenase complex dihydrolipoamide acyltransferase (E2) component
LTTVEGTGPVGEIIENDVEAVATADGKTTGGEATGTAVAEPTEIRELTVTNRRELTGVQKRVSDRMQASFQNAPYVTLHRTIDTSVMTWGFLPPKRSVSRSR